MDLMNTDFGYSGPEWTSTYITKLDRDINNLKLSVVRILSGYQKSGLVTVKRHMVQHVSDDIARNDDLILCYTGVLIFTYNL